jgi:hypothetical protein
MVKSTASSATWLVALRAYLLVLAVGNLIWEAAHLPLYTIWRTGTWRENAFAVVHCTGGDLLIGTASLILALVLAGHQAWPARRFGLVATLAMVFGLAYTTFSEWLNIVIRQSWAYSELMPVLSLGGFDLGLSPLAQWIVVPLIAFVVARRCAPDQSRPEGGNL